MEGAKELAVGMIDVDGGVVVADDVIVTVVAEEGRTAAVTAWSGGATADATRVRADWVRRV